MASKTKKLRAMKNWKDKPNKANQKADMKRIEKNREVLKDLAANEGA